MGMKGDTENMKHVWQIFLFLTVLVSCFTGCGRRQAMEIEEETFPAVSSFEEESQEETEVPSVFCISFAPSFLFSVIFFPAIPIKSAQLIDIIFCFLHRHIVNDYFKYTRIKSTGNNV